MVTRELGHIDQPRFKVYDNTHRARELLIQSYASEHRSQHVPASFQMIPTDIWRAFVVARSIAGHTCARMLRTGTDGHGLRCHMILCRAQQLCFLALAHSSKKSAACA